MKVSTCPTCGTQIIQQDKKTKVVVSQTHQDVSNPDIKILSTWILTNGD